MIFFLYLLKRICYNVCQYFCILSEDWTRTGDCRRGSEPFFTENHTGCTENIVAAPYSQCSKCAWNFTGRESDFMKNNSWIRMFCLLLLLCHSCCHSHCSPASEGCIHKRGFAASFPCWSIYAASAAARHEVTFFPNVRPRNWFLCHAESSTSRSYLVSIAV